MIQTNHFWDLTTGERDYPSLTVLRTMTVFSSPQIKITALEGQKKEVKQKYNDALSAYTTQYFGRPLDKLNVFFDGVQQLVSAGVKESEIGYQLAYSKQELRKVINMYPGKEVKKGLESLYKKVERHLCEEEGLVQVIPRSWFFVI